MIRTAPLLLALFFAVPGYVMEEGSMRLPNELKNADIVDKAGAKIPLDIKLTDHDGKAVVLGDYFKGQANQIVVLLISYYGCAGLCSLVYNAALAALKEVSFRLGKDYKIVSVSIDHRETPELANAKRANYVATLRPEDDPSAWSFHVTSAAEAKRLADAVGFNYFYDYKLDQFAHGAGFFVLSPRSKDGDVILSRTLYGIEFRPSDVKLALTEAAEGKIGSFVDRVILSCFHYDPDSHRYGVYVFGVMRLGGIITMLVVGFLLVFYFRNERKRMNFSH